MLTAQAPFEFPFWRCLSQRPRQSGNSSCHGLCPCLGGRAAGSSTHGERNKKTILAWGPSRFLQASICIDKAYVLIPVWLLWLYHLGQDSEKNGTWRSPHTPSSIFLIFKSQCPSRCLFYLTNPQNSFAVLNSECMAHRHKAVHSSYQGCCCFVTTQRDFWSFSSLSKGSEATRKQALVRRGESAVSLCFMMTALPGSDVPGKLS